MNGTRSWRLVAGLLLAAAGLAAASAGAAEATPTPTVEAGERQRLAVQRRLIEAEHGAHERECALRFAVTSCLDENRERRRQALAAVNARLTAIDDRQRARRAAVRTRRIDAKTTRQAAAQEKRAAAPLLPLVVPVDPVR